MLFIKLYTKLKFSLGKPKPSSDTTQAERLQKPIFSESTNDNAA